jgi:hypothetical protein
MHRRSHCEQLSSVVHSEAAVPQSDDPAILAPAELRHTLLDACDHQQQVVEAARLAAQHFAAGYRPGDFIALLWTASGSHTGFARTALVWMFCLRVRLSTPLMLQVIYARAAQCSGSPTIRNSFTNASKSCWRRERGRRSAELTLAWFRLQEPLRQKGRPRLFADYPIDGKVFVLLIVLD